MPGNRHTKRPDKSLGRSIAPRGSSRSNCQVKAILHGGIETGAKMRGKAQRERNGGEWNGEGTEEWNGEGTEEWNGGERNGEGTEEWNGGEAGAGRAFCCNFDLLPHK